MGRRRTLAIPTSEALSVRRSPLGSACGLRVAVGFLCALFLAGAVSAVQRDYTWTGFSDTNYLDSSNWFDENDGATAAVPPNNAADTYTVLIDSSETQFSDADVVLTSAFVAIDAATIHDTSNFREARLEIEAGATLDVLGSFQNLGGSLVVGVGSVLSVGSFVQGDGSAFGAPATHVAGTLNVSSGGDVELRDDSELVYSPGSQGLLQSPTVSGGRLSILGSVEVEGGSVAASRTRVSGDLELRSATSLGGLLVEAKGTGAEIRLGPDSSSVSASAEVLQALDGGVLDLGSGSTVFSSTRIFANGSLVGNGTIFGEVINGSGGTVSPGDSPGTLTLGSSYLQDGESRLLIEIFGPMTHDLVAVGGHASLDGTLEVILGGGFSPMTGQSFVVMTYDSRDGVFSELVGMQLGDGREFQPNYGPTELTLTVPEPGPGLPLAVGCAAILALARRSHREPV